MKTVYFTAQKSPFAKALAAIFAENGYAVTDQVTEGIEFFIDTTEERICGDDKSVLEGVDAQAALEAFRENVCRPLEKLEAVLPHMTGLRRVCFLNSADASVNMSTAVTDYGHNMAKAALNQILTITKNKLVQRGEGYTFRLFDPLGATVAPADAAASAYVYFTRQRYDNGPEEPDRYEEEFLVVRDALGRELPW